MDRQEFLNALRHSMSGELPDYEVENNIRYYESYLTDEEGKTVEDKIKELGEPRLIARTIIDAYMVNHESSGDRSGYYTGEYDKSYDEEYDAGETENNTGSHHTVRYYSWDTMKWYQKVLTVIIGVLIVVVLIGLFTLGVNIFFQIVLPVLLVVFGVKLIINLFRR